MKKEYWVLYVQHILPREYFQAGRLYRIKEIHHGKPAGLTGAAIYRMDNPGVQWPLQVLALLAAVILLMRERFLVA